MLPEKISRPHHLPRVVKPYCVKKGLFTPEECDQIVANAHKLIKPELEVIPGEMLSGDGKKSNKFALDLHPFHFAEERIFDFVRKANKQNFGFKDDFVTSEPMYLNEYTGDEYCGWHVDGFVSDNALYLYRKLTCIVQLSDPKEYTGGKFETYKYHGIEEDITEKGTAFIIPSFEWHQVTPVTSGMRRSLLLFVEGRDRFR